MYASFVGREIMVRLKQRFPKIVGTTEQSSAELRRDTADMIFC
jgi:hypothetical protein